jgi:hypothetical protein
LVGTKPFNQLGLHVLFDNVPIKSARLPPRTEGAGAAAWRRLAGLGCLVTGFTSSAHFSARPTNPDAIAKRFGNCGTRPTSLEIGFFELRSVGRMKGVVLEVERGSAVAR